MDLRRRSTRRDALSRQTITTEIEGMEKLIDTVFDTLVLVAMLVVPSLNPLKKDMVFTKA
jgi:hypothetical protein